MYNLACPPGEDSDQPAHLHNLINLKFSAETLDPCLPIACRSKTDQTDSMDVQSDLVQNCLQRLPAELRKS